MNETIVFIRRINNGYANLEISSDYGYQQYLYYTKREAMKKYREKYGLKYKRLWIIDETR